MQKRELIRGTLLSISLLFTIGCSTKMENKKVVNQKKTECFKEIKGCQQKRVSLESLLKQKPIKKLKKVEPKIFKLKTVGGRRIDIIEKKKGFIFPQFPNKVVVLEFFGKDCHHCIQEIATLNRLYKKYTNQLEIISIQVDGQMGKSFAKKFINKHQIKYPIIDENGSEDLQYSVRDKYEWRGVLPYMLVINRGVTEFSYLGKVDYKRIYNDIRLMKRDNFLVMRVK